jgi:hypothetical protein
MSEAVKIKAGIPSTKCRNKKQTKDEQIRELQACLATLEHPAEMAAVSKEPLVSQCPFEFPHCVASHHHSVLKR